MLSNHANVYHFFPQNYKFYTEHPKGMAIDKIISRLII